MAPDRARGHRGCGGVARGLPRTPWVRRKGATEPTTSTRHEENTMKHPATSRTTRRRAFAAASVTAFGLAICGWSSAHVQAAPTPAETLSVETAGDIPEAADASNIAAEVVKGWIAVGYVVEQAALAGKATVPVAQYYEAVSYTHLRAHET